MAYSDPVKKKANDKRYRTAHRAERKAYSRSHPRRWDTKQAAGQISRRYGISISYRDSLIRDQGGGCAICDKQMIRPCVDHNHVTGKIRGILCVQCNTVLGLMADDPVRLSRAVDYLSGVPSL